jgi:hypothetical protein
MAITCGICVPRTESGMEELANDNGACLRRAGHAGPHLFWNVHGTFYVWDADKSCDCCDPTDPDRCFDFGTVSKEEAGTLLNSNT